MTGAASIYSPLWFRVARLVPRLRGHVRIRRQHYRGERWVLLVDPASGRAHRLDAGAWALVGLFNGQRSLDTAWQQLRATQGDALPTQDEALHLLVQLHEAGLVHCPLDVQAQELFARHEKRERSQRLAASNPLSFRARLGDPARLLAALAPLGRWLFSPAGALLWLALVAAAGLGAALNAPRLAAQAAEWLPRLSSVAWVWAVYPVLKALHELAHGLAVRRLGGDVHDAGVSLLYLMPVPWVDASAANGMPLARHRMLVSAAGVLAETGLAAIALLAWLVLEPGWARDLAFAVVATGVVSTLLANANPLLRLDGYYFATDALQLPNLALRSGLWWRQALLRHGLRLQGPQAEPLPCAQGERPWLVAYAPLSWAYRAFLSIVTALWLGGLSAWLGGAVLLLAGWGLLVKPAWAAWRFLRGSGLAHQQAPRAQRRALVLAAAGVAVLALLPWPFVTTAQGVVWLPEQAWVRLGVDGTVAGFAAEDGARVVPGTPLLALDNPELASRVQQVQQQLAGAQAEFYRAIPGSGPHGAATALAASLADELATLQQRQAQRQVAAGLGGVLSLPHQPALLGRWFERGETLGHVLPPGNNTLQVVVPQADALLLRGERPTIEVRTADQPLRVLHARLVQATPAVGARLPSAALGTPAGGPITTDPQDKEGRTAQEPVALLELQVDQPLGALVGARAWVRFHHGHQPLAQQALRRLRQLVLQRFAPTPA